MFKIEKGVPLPQSTRTAWPYSDMKIGDSFAVPIAMRGKATSAMSAHKNRTPGLQFMQRSVTENGELMVRIWRTA